MLNRRRHLRRTSLTLTIGVCLALVTMAVPVGLATASGAAPTGVAATSDVFAKRGDQSLRVVHVQQLLINAGIAVKGGADGVFGSGTEAAVKQVAAQGYVLTPGRYVGAEAAEEDS